MFVLTTSPMTARDTPGTATRRRVASLSVTARQGPQHRQARDAGDARGGCGLATPTVALRGR